jgi:ADP-ribosylglycohydrolase
MDSTPQARLERARVSLEGLSVGDAFGERFFIHPNVAHLLIGDRALPAPVWEYTDDTQMALSIVAVLGRHETLDQDRLAKSFGTHYQRSRLRAPGVSHGGASRVARRATEVHFVAGL